MGIYDALKKRFEAPRYALLFEVANSTGWASRYADAIAMSLWKSRGLDLHGIEVKESRSDWLRELKDPTKSAEIQCYCDFWWIVTPKGLVRPDELPPTWGLLELHGEKTLRQKVAAPRLEDREPIGRPFLAAICRRLAEAQAQWVPRTSLEEETEDLRKAAYDCGVADGQRAMQQIKRAHDDMRSAIDGFEAATGLKLNRWNADDIAEQIKLAQNVDALQRAAKGLGYARDRVVKMIDHFDELDAAVAESERVLKASA